MPTEKTESFAVNLIRYREQVFILADDVAELIREVAASEETDVRDRLNVLANNIAKVKSSFPPA